MLYRDRNAIECMFCKLKDYRRIATCYDKLAANFPGAIYLAAAVSHWLCVRTLALLWQIFWLRASLRIPGSEFA